MLEFRVIIPLGAGQLQGMGMKFVRFFSCPHVFLAEVRILGASPEAFVRTDPIPTAPCATDNIRLALPAQGLTHQKQGTKD